MIQREVRDRLLAEPGTKAYGALTVFTRGVFEVRSVSHRTRWGVPSTTTCRERRGFAQAASTRDRCGTPGLRAQRSSVVRGPAQDLAQRPHTRLSCRVVDQALAAAGIDGKRRGETLSPEEFERSDKHSTL